MKSVTKSTQMRQKSVLKKIAATQMSHIYNFTC